MKLFSDLDQKINKKREKREFDEEALDLTEQILGVNPDVSTLWNFRREIFLKWREDGGFTEKLVNVSRKELAFLQGCLKVNPKSYGVWFHRQWVNEFIPAPDWTQELLLCNMFLSFDERNFHCWDYRRIVTKKANITAHEEFKFSTEKITENFSNYSSWHYRSKLLLLIHPDPSGNPERIEETALMNEFELAQNAFFTDPSDQSAWFYHRWLLGRDQPELDVDCLYTRRQCRHLTTIVQLSKPAKIIQLSPSLFINSVEVLTEWRNVFCTDQPCHLWISLPLFHLA
ncbi:predicted protein [Nematostella vectensis]|uniref:Geranylgeranyl transferase type-2 subunit alpha n=1 Tax=Nematostella vectensis TaxID=45351 RepID=A7SL75_NEMVE|nr:predicted protein [Nematostella vectensis]|eukprot:XP_001627625.1 predicted protein [Nematostella vectensis]